MPETKPEEKAAEETTNQEETPAEEKTEDKEVNWERKKKGKKGEPTEEKKEDLLERPENALSLAEYREQLKLKNQAIQNKPVKTIPVQNSDLKPQTKDEDLTIGINIGTNKKQNKPKPKEKKPDSKELNVEFKTEDTEERRYDNRDRNQGNYGKKKFNQGPKFQFSKDDFPEL